jgi:drug/metabolite transporter (DMT)-like permease
MSLESIFLVLLSAGIHIAWNSLTKSSSNPRVFSLFKGSFLMIGALFVPFFLDLTTIPLGLWMIIILSGIIHTFYILSLSSAYQEGEISFVYPIVRSAPALIPGVAFIVFAERISLKGGIGILIVVVCIFILTIQGKVSKQRSIIKTVFRIEHKWAFATLGTVVAYSIVDKMGMLTIRDVKQLSAEGQPIIYFILMNAVCYIFYWIVMLSKPGVVNVSVFREEWWKIVLSALGTMTSYSLILHVMKTENLSYIVTLRQSSILFAVFIGWFFFREPYFRMRLLIAACMIFGLYLTVTG